MSKEVQDRIDKMIKKSEVILNAGRQTNEEWFCNLSTEEKVKALLDLREKIRQKMRAELGSENKFYKGDYYREWLKEKH